MTTGPVFVDVSGRRRRLASRLGIAVGALLTAYLLVVGIGLIAGADVPMSPWPNGRSSNAPANTRNAIGGAAPKVAPKRAVSPGRQSSSAAPSGAASGGGTQPATAPTSTSGATAAAIPSRSPTKGPGYGSTKSPNPHRSP